MSENPASKKFDLQLLWRILKEALPYRASFVLCTVLAIVLAPLSTLRPWLIQEMVDKHIYTGDIPGMVRMTLWVLGVLLLEVYLTYLFQYRTSWLGQQVIRKMRVRVFGHVIHLPLSYFDRTPIGTIITRTISDIQTIHSIFSEGIITILADILTVATVLGIMFYTNWKLTLVCMTVLPFLLAGTYIFKEKVKASFQKVRAEIARMNAFLQERITGMRTIQIFTAEKQEAEKFRAINHSYTTANLQSILYYAVFFPFVEIISAACLGLMVWYGARGVMEGQVTLGVLVAFPIYINMLFRPIRTLADKFNTLQMGLVSAERVYHILENRQQTRNTGTLVREKLEGRVEFDKVWFAYQADDYVLKDISFSVEPGQSVALLGATGSGKSTIINLLSRLYPVSKGEIRVDDTPLDSFELYHFRRHIAVVLQDVFLFSGSILENITLRDPSISREAVIEAAQRIGAHEIISQLPGAYDYQVRERGAMLSMGQRQLISFVRALVFDPRILILDEATSSIDLYTESVIQSAIEKLTEKRTSFIIAHRLSTIRHADKILVLEKGELKETGTHESLYSNEKGLYRKMFDLQKGSEQVTLQH